MNEIISYIEENYSPLSIVVYGSYNNGTNDADSDFDCMIIVKDKSVSHDTSIVENVRLDLFVYTVEEINNSDNYTEFVQIYDSGIVKDTNGIAGLLKLKVNEYIKKNLIKSVTEKEDMKAWLKKMLKRAERNDVEGFYRYHLALVESLEIYFDLRDMYYSGPKRSIRFLKDNDASAFELFDKALRLTDCKYLTEWIGYVIKVK